MYALRCRIHGRLYNTENQHLFQTFGRLRRWRRQFRRRIVRRRRFIQPFLIQYININKKLQSMKTIFIMGILNFFCGISAAQPQYWGEGAYDLGNVVFGMNVDKYYSKARLYDEDYDESFRYFMKKKVKCKTQEGKNAVIQEYSSVETNYGEVLARFGKFEFPYTGMVADKSGKLIGILAQGRLDEAAAVDSLLYAIAGKYGVDTN